VNIKNIFRKEMLNLQIAGSTMVKIFAFFGKGLPHVLTAVCLLPADDLQNQDYLYKWCVTLSCVTS